jgi:hypothetical protein
VIVYVWGNLTADNFTPRPGKDTIGRPGQTPGLSASETMQAGKKAQGIDLDKLRPPLKAFADEPDRGGTPGHIAIAPADDNGDVDLQKLEAWASFRQSGRIHELTQILLDAVVERNVKGARQ